MTVAIVDAYAAPTILSDANEWSDQNGIAAFRGSQFTQDTPGPTVTTSRPSATAGLVRRGDLDVEAVHAMAPGANVSVRRR